MRKLLVVALLPLVLAGCSHRYGIYSLESEEYSSFSHMARYGHGTLFLRGGRQLYVHDLELGLDTTTYQLWRSRDVSRVPTCEVDSIIFTRRAVGALQGFGVGAVGAAAVGALVGLVVGADSPEHCGGQEFCITRTQVVGILALLSAPVGAVIGALTGASIGDKLIYYPFPGETGDARPDSAPQSVGADTGLSNKPLQQTAPRPPTPGD